MTKTDEPSPEERENYDRCRQLVLGANINPDTLLATDYLNLFNEVVMLFGIIPDMPECLDELKEWHPKTYREHFESSCIKDAQLAIDVYGAVPSCYKEPFEKNILHMDRLVAHCVKDVERAVAAGDPDELRRLCEDVAQRLNNLIAALDTIIHGDAQTFRQCEIDDIMEGL